MLFGYIRDIKTSDNLSIIIPDEIKKLIVLFYRIRMAFDQRHIGKNLEILKENIIKNISIGFASCIFGPEISNADSNQFSIEIKARKRCYLYFGFITGKVADINFKYDLHDNRTHCVGFGADKHCKEFYLFDKNNEFVKLRNYRCSNIFKEGDTFRMNVNFNKNELSLYHNGTFAEKTSLYHHKKLVPAMSLSGKGDEIEVTDYSF